MGAPLGDALGVARRSRAHRDDGEPLERRIPELGAELQLGRVEDAEVLPGHGVEGVMRRVLGLDQERAVRPQALGRRPQERQRPLARPEVGHAQQLVRRDEPDEAERGRPE
jgi:hypothetical protein